MARTEDLTKYGMIRVPSGDCRSSCRVIQPTRTRSGRCALATEERADSKQYQRLFEMEDVQLRFTERGAPPSPGSEAVGAVRRAGLRAIMEEVMLDVMYEIPDDRRARVRDHGTSSSTASARSLSARRRPVDVRPGAVPAQLSREPFVPRRAPRSPVSDAAASPAKSAIAAALRRQGP